MRVKKWFQRLYLRIVREKASVEYIARGWAIGMFFGCASPFGFQLVFSIPVAFILKGSKIGATFGTLLTNHFTIFFIYPIQCFVGNRLIGGNVSYEAIKKAMKNVAQEQSYKALMEISGELIAGFFIGGLLLALITTPTTYWLVKFLVRKYRKNKAERTARKYTNNNTRQSQE